MRMYCIYIIARCGYNLTLSNCTYTYLFAILFFLIVMRYIIRIIFNHIIIQSFGKPYNINGHNLQDLTIKKHDLGIIIDSKLTFDIILTQFP